MKTFLLALTAVVLLITPALGQEPIGGRSSGQRSRGPEVPPAALSISISGEVLQTDLERNGIQIRIKRSRREVGFFLDPKCTIRADKKQFGKKELTLEEIQPGYLVDLIVRRADMHIIEMKVKKPKEPSPTG